MKPFYLALACLLPLSCQQASRSSEQASSETAAPTAEELVTAAQQSIDEGQPRDALPLLDRLLEQDEANARAWFLRGEANMAVGELDPTVALFFYSDALADFEHARELGFGVEADFAASRAARMNFDAEKAVLYAREGMARLEAIVPPPPLEPAPERILVEASFDAFVNAKNSGQDGREYFEEIEGLLRSRVEDDPDDEWAREQLALLYQWEARFEDSIDLLQAGLDLDPESATLHERLVAVATAAGGRERVLDAYDEFNAKHDGVALGIWFPAMQVFMQGLDEVLEQRDGSALFREAEGMLVRCRTMQPEFTDDCKGWEVMCRGGVGWSFYWQEDLDGAFDAFVSMEEILPEGMTWQIRGSLLSGVDGLRFIADSYVRENDLAGAAGIFEFLREYDENNGDFANNAGFFHREAGTEAMEVSRSLLRMADRNEDPAEAAEQRSGAEELREFAIEHMQGSWDAYVAASALSPEDVRVINDTGLVMVYHLRTDAEAAEEYLMRAVELGEQQLADETLIADEYDTLLEAYGDAHQNLGLLYLTMYADPDTALVWFEKCLEVDPRPTRIWVTQNAIPACEIAKERELDLQRDLDPRIW